MRRLLIPVSLFLLAACSSGGITPAEPTSPADPSRPGQVTEGGGGAQGGSTPQAPPVTVDPTPDTPEIAKAKSEALEIADKLQQRFKELGVELKNLPAAEAEKVIGGVEGVLYLPGLLSYERAGIVLCVRLAQDPSNPPLVEERDCKE